MPGTAIALTDRERATIYIALRCLGKQLGVRHFAYLSRLKIRAPRWIGDQVPLSENQIEGLCRILAEAP